MMWQEHLRALEPDWDSYGAKSISEAAIAAVEAMLPRLNVPLWIVPDIDGGIGLEDVSATNVPHFGVDVTPDGQKWSWFVERWEYDDNHEAICEDLSGLTADAIVARFQASGIEFAPIENPSEMEWVPGMVTA